MQNFVISLPQFYVMYKQDDGIEKSRKMTL